MKMYTYNQKKNITVFDLINKKNEKKKKKKNISEEKNIRAYISGTPYTSSIERLSQFMKDRGVTDVFCFCKLKYDPNVLTRYDINFHHLYFPDGETPSPLILENFNTIISDIQNRDNGDKAKIFLHCESGMGRAPTMLAYLMITRFKWKRMDCVSVIRKNRRGVINKKQLNWISDKKFKENNNCCIIL